MTRIDHIAFRTADRQATANFFVKALGYRIQEEFDLTFPDGSKTKCIALEPGTRVQDAPWTAMLPISENTSTEYHSPPEIFCSDSDDPKSIVGQWVQNRGGVGGIHHIALQVDSVEKTMQEWKEKGFCEFTTESPITCEDNPLKQVFSKPSELCGGIIFELIERGTRGFCGPSVTKLITSTKDFK